VRASSSAGQIVVTTVADPSVPRGVAAMAARRAGADARELIERGSPATEIRVESR